MWQKLIGSTLGFASSLKFKVILGAIITSVVIYKTYDIGYAVGREDVLGDKVVELEATLEAQKEAYDRLLVEYNASVEAANNNTVTVTEIVERIVEVEVPKDVIRTEIIEVCTSGGADDTYAGLLVRYNALVRAATSPD